MLKTSHLSTRHAAPSRGLRGVVAAALLGLLQPQWSCRNFETDGVDLKDGRGIIGATLVSDTLGDDVVAVRVEVGFQGTPIASQTIRLDSDFVPMGSEHATPGGDAYFVVAPGLYTVSAQPLAADGGASVVCASASTSATVLANQTTEIVMPILCGSGAAGGLDVVILVQHQPSITGLVLTPSKFIETCEALFMEVIASDPTGGGLEYSWRVASAPPDSAPSLVDAGATARFIALTPGEYEIEVEVKSGSGHFARLSFPLHVSGESFAECPPEPPPLLTPTLRPGTTEFSTLATIIRARNVELSTNAGAVASYQELMLPVFPNTELHLVGNRLSAAGAGFVWVGNILGQPRSLAVLSFQPGALAASIESERGELYQIRAIGNGVHTVAQIDPTRFPHENFVATAFPPAADPDPCDGTDPGTDIDLMVAYTADARAANGGTEGTQALIYLALEETNQSYINSGITPRVRLVHLEEVVYTESHNSTLDKIRLQDPSDGFMDGIHASRDAHGADAVLLVASNLGGSICGEAYAIMGTVSTAFESSAFAVVEDSCATGYYSFGHELGHLQGARHDRYVDNTDGSPYYYNHGHTNPPDGWRTVMAYNSACAAASTYCTRLPYWSNPGVAWGGDPMGTAAGLPTAADNHLTLNNTAATVANFRCSSPNAENVWMRDTWNDTGLEPDPATAAESMWRSPYIWVRTSQDVDQVHQHQHQNPELGSPAWIYVKQHNAGDVPASGDLKVYYANASTSLTWPSAWTLIDTIPVAAFPAHSTQVVEVPWPALPGTGHFCLLARWESLTDPMTSPEGADINANVRGNNNIVWKNINILEDSGDGTMDAVFVVQAPPEPEAFSLFLGPAPEQQNGSFFFYGHGEMRMDEALMSAWRQGGALGEGFELLADGALRVTHPAGMTLHNITLPSEIRATAKLHLWRSATTPERVFFVEAKQLIPRGNQRVMRIIGGITYELHPRR